jgi:hypothetical protein
MMALISGALKRARVRWEHACLAAQAGLLGFSLCLRPVNPQGATEHVAALELTSAERRGPES